MLLEFPIYTTFSDDEACNHKFVTHDDKALDGAHSLCLLVLGSWTVTVTRPQPSNHPRYHSNIGLWTTPGRSTLRVTYAASRDSVKQGVHEGASINTG